MQRLHHQTLPSPNHTFAFSVHEQPDIQHKTSATFASQTNSRQKRRRTSPEDQVILEAAYKNNAKPDKLERAALLKKVTFGEKELAIWFQNRRQVSRRRSRPSASDDFSSQELTSSSISYEGSSQDTASSQQSMPDSGQPILVTVPVQLPGHGSSMANVFDTRNETSSQEQHKTHQEFIAPPQRNTDEVAASLAIPSSRSASDDPMPRISKPVKITKQPSHVPFTLYDQFQAGIQAAAKTIPPPSLKRTASHPRLATSLDGSVRVKTGNSPTPSPPRTQNSLMARQPRGLGPLQRSQSAIVPPTFPVPRPTASIGRSRDSRTWEFYCDPNARDELTMQAEREQSGSAVGAIGLIRSRSKGSLAAGTNIGNPNKRVAAASKVDSGKRLKADHTTRTSKSNLVRSSSSVGRFQTAASTTGTGNSKKPSKSVGADEGTGEPPEKKKTKKKPTSTELLDGNESDKENWVPGTQTSVTPLHDPHRRPNAATASRKKILTENQHIPSLSSSLDVLMSRDSSGNGRHPRRAAKTGTQIVDHESGQENGADSDSEVRGFMSRGSGVNVVVGEDGDEGDLDCVEGLLKLSRGDWR